jgi:DNA/RNA-binding domain of Phe-tRNA-synthetase-like protein
MNIAIKDKKFKAWLDSLRTIKTNGVRKLESFEAMLKRVLRYESK